MTKKSRFINKLAALSANDRNELIAFFTENPIFENLIDWNNRNLKRDDFNAVFALNRLSGKKRNNTINMFINYNCKIICHTEEFVIVVPLDWYCAKFLNSFKCGGEGTKWCIGNKQSDSHWNHYMETGNYFYFIYFFERHPVFGKKLMIRIDDQNKSSFFTQSDGQHDFDLLANYLRDKIFIDIQ